MHIYTYVIYMYIYIYICMYKYSCLYNIYISNFSKSKSIFFLIRINEFDFDCEILLNKK